MSSPSLIRFNHFHSIWRKTMSRLNTLSDQQATDSTTKLFSSIQGKLGTVPNMMRAMGNSPAALSAYLQFSGQLAGGILTAKQRELIALTVGQANGCDYCLAAHSALGKMAGLSADQIADARRGQSVNSADEALLQLASQLVAERGHVTDAELSKVREHGFDDAAIAEVIANVALNLFTNYFNHVADPDVDFPAAEKMAAA